MTTLIEITKHKNGKYYIYNQEGELVAIGDDIHITEETDNGIEEYIIESAHG